MRTAAEIVAALERERRELEHHMEHHPSERWAAKLETVEMVLGWARGGQ